MMLPRNLPSAFVLAAIVAASTGAAVTAVPAVADTTPTSTATTPPASNPTPPTVATSGVTSLSRTSASLTGAVTPGNADTSYHFQYGTSTSYGLVTPDVSIPAGTSAVNVSQGISSLTVGTTYHYRLVATNAAGSVNGADKSFTTQANPKAPTIATLAATNVAPTSAQVNAHVNPNGQDTSVIWQWGTTTKYGATTTDVDAGSGTATVTVGLPVTGLAGNTKYHYRAIAQNGTGKVTGSDHTFTTPRGLTGVGMTITPNPVVWGSAAVVSGTVGGAGVGGVGVQLLQQDFPFTGTFHQIATQTASSAGAYSFSIPKATSALNLEVVTQTTTPVTSPVAKLKVQLFTTLKIAKKTTKTYTLSGLIYPQIPSSATVSVQRKTPKGRWITTRHAHLKKVDTTASSVRTNAARISRSTSYRLKITPHNGGANEVTYSSSIKVPKRR